MKKLALFGIAALIAGCGAPPETTVVSKGPPVSDQPVSAPSKSDDAHATDTSKPTAPIPPSTPTATPTPTKPESSPSPSTGGRSGPATSASQSVPGKKMTAWRQEYPKQGDVPAGLIFTDDGRFVWTYDGMPYSGTFTKKGANYDLTVLSALGQPLQAIKSVGIKDPTLVGTLLKAKISTDGQSLKVFPPKREAEAIAMKPGQAEDLGPKTVTDSEGKLLGHYFVMVDAPGMKMGDPAAQAQVDDALKNSTLELRADNTYKLFIIFPMFGKWHVDGNRVLLRMPASFRMMTGGGSKPDLSFEVSSDSTTLTAKQSTPAVKIVCKRNG